MKSIILRVVISFAEMEKSKSNQHTRSNRNCSHVWGCQRGKYMDIFIDKESLFLDIEAILGTGHHTLVLRK